MVLSVTVLDVMMNHVDGGSAQRDIRTHLAPSHGGMLVELRRRHHVHTALRRLQERRVHDVRRAVHAYVVDVEQADWHGERRGELLAAGSDDVQLLLGRRRAANPLANHRRCDHRLQAPALAARTQHPRLRVEGDMPDLASGMVLPDRRHIVDQRRGTDATVDLDEQHALVAMPEESLREDAHCGV